jgi:S-formylglutathione hydrolase FrmB
MLIQELIPEIDSSFRTVTSREGRIIEGFSMGGYGAGRLGLKYHNLFCAVSMLAAGPLHPEFETRRVGPPGRDKLLNEVYGGDMEYFRAMSPWRLAEQNAGAVRNGMFFRVVIGDQDNTLDFSRGFSEHMTQLNIPHTFMVLPGIDHNPMKTLNALGEDNWAFYRQAFGPLLTESLKKEIP